MITKINKTEKILERLRKEGKSRFLDSPEDIKRMKEMDESLRKDHEEFIRKQSGSERESWNVWLD
jgi:hypothetical protein